MDSRRTFIKTVFVALGAGATILKSGIASAKKEALKLDKVPALQKVGGSAKVKLAGKEILFIRDTDTSVRAIHPVCTHRGCPVTFSSKESKIVCECHDSVFKLDGKVLKGPAVNPLKVYPAKLDNGSIVVTVD
jgi:cytochrome b6-f complex iron-sulfur subunit